MILKKGYTTGVHTSFAFRSALNIHIKTQQLTISKTNKMDNDDLDVTKGCQIIVTISNNLDHLKLNKIPHNPYIFKNQKSTLYIYAGDGVGVVTKDGLKPPKNHPAINPVPLKSLKDIFNSYNTTQDIFCTVGVKDGEKLAQQTANSKVGILGGISILGTMGYVKPISATAYIHSIDQELNYAKANGYKTVIFTLGNSAYKLAQTIQNVDIIEIGNFVYDGIKLAISKDFRTIKL